MAGSACEDNGSLRPSEDLSSGQFCQSGDSLGEWRSSEQVENGTPSTSPPYWDTDDDDDDCGPKPSELFGRFTWKIEKFSQISKRELRSNAFEVGGYKWYILIYPQGCDVSNHLSLFLCVANHDKLLPGWSHFAQFTIAVVNKDPKKSKYSDTLHRFWKKEHDWGWKKFMELTKVFDGFIVSDTLVIKAQVQVIRAKADRPFRCLDCEYRRELVRVYLSNVELTCRRFVEERRTKLGKLIEDKVRWLSFRAFWLGMDQSARRCMSRDKTDAILKVVVKHFFIEKEVTSTLVMDALHSGLKALENQSSSKSKKERGTKAGGVENTPAPIVRVESDMFVLADDVLVLLERAAMEPLPPKDDKGPQNRTKDGSSGEDFNKDSIERDERRLTELGRRTVELFVLAHIFSNRIEVAYQEEVALKRQEELIREEEAAGQAENVFKSKRGGSEKEKRSKKRQAKHKRSNCRAKDKGKAEKSGAIGQDKNRHGSSYTTNDMGIQCANEKPDSDVTDGDVFQPDSEDRDVDPVNWDTDTSEVLRPREASSRGMGSLTLQNGGEEKRFIMDDSSSTCSTDSVPSTMMNGSFKGNNPLSNSGTQLSAARGKAPCKKTSGDQNHWNMDTDNQSLESSLRRRRSTSRDGPESEAVVLSSKDQIQRLEQTLVEKEEEVVSLQRKLTVKDEVEGEKPSKSRSTDLLSSPTSPSRNVPSNSHAKRAAELVVVRTEPSKGICKSEKIVVSVTSSPQLSCSNVEAHRPTILRKPANTTTEKAVNQQVPAMSRPSSAPVIPAPRPNASVASRVQTTALLARSVSAAGRLGTEPTTTTHSYAQPSYRNAIMGNTSGTSSANYVPGPSSGCLNSQFVSQSPSAMASTTTALLSRGSTGKDGMLGKSGFRFGTVTPEIFLHPQWMEVPREALADAMDPGVLREISCPGICGSTSGGYQMGFPDEVQARQAQDDFPHLDIINYLLDEEQSIGRAGKMSGMLHNPSNGHHQRAFSQPTTFPYQIAAADVGFSMNSCRFDVSSRYHEDETLRTYNTSSQVYNVRRSVSPQISLSTLATRQVDGVMANQWLLNGTDPSILHLRNIDGDGYPFQIPDYSSLACGVDGYTMFRPSNRH